MIGGLGGAVAELICDAFPVPLRRVGVEDVWGESGSAAMLLDAYGISAANIAAKARAAVNAKKE